MGHSFVPDLRQGRRRTKEERTKTAALTWIPQERQLKFFEFLGLDHAFDYFMGEKNGKPVLVKRKNKPDKIRPPKADIVGYGGAAGGGKSDAMLMALFIAIMSNPGAKCGYFRRTYAQLEGAGGVIMRSKELFTDFPGAKWNGTQRTWTFTEQRNGIITFNHLQNEDDVFDYQSQQFDYIAFDEATQFLRSQYRYLTSRNRSTVKGTYPVMMLATNPGGVGHVWFKREFIDIGPPEEPAEVMVESDPPAYETHVFVPAYLDDNFILNDRDPSYRKKLENMDRINKARLLEGDWDIHEGQFFGEFDRNIHVIKPFEIPDWWKRFISIDYGLDMAAVYWYALDDIGFYYVYKELYEPDLSLSDLAKAIRGMTSPIEKDALAYTVVPPDLFNTRRQETGKSGREILVDNGLVGYGLRRADNRRVEGWRATREYIKPFPDPTFEGQEEDAPLVARVRFFNNVKHLPSDLPLLQHSDKDPNDAATEPHSITHGPDSFRYFCMSRPAIRSLSDEERKRLNKERMKRVQARYKSTGY